jgi:hypothetical protein
VEQDAVVEKRNYQVAWRFLFLQISLPLGILKTDAFSFVHTANRLAYIFRRWLSGGVPQHLKWYLLAQYHAFAGVMLGGRRPFIRRIITHVNYLMQVQS